MVRQHPPQTTGTPRTNQPNKQTPERTPCRACRGACRWSRLIGLRNARWGRGAGARTAHRTSISRHRVYSDSHVDGCCRLVASTEEREQRRRCSGQNVLGKHHLLHEASCSTPRDLVMTDAHEIHRAASMAGPLASGASVCAVGLLQRTRFFIECRGNFGK